MHNSLPDVQSTLSLKETIMLMSHCTMNLWVLVQIIFASTILNTAAEEKTICSIESEKGTSNVGCCGNSTFDPGRELCCGGNVETNLGNRECCGASSFDMNNESLECCSGVLHHTAGYYYDCCGQNVYDESKSVCCRNEQNNSSNPVILKRIANNTQCCCTSPYDADLKDCDQTTCKVLQKGQKVCSGEPYNETDDKCCDGKLHKGISEKNTSVSCCGKYLMKLGEDNCCGQSVALNGLACCSGKIFNGTTQRCCRSFVVDVDNVNQECCGGDLHDTTTHGCCSFTSYNKTTHQCCRDTITPLDQECCDSIGYDPSNQICCNYRNEKSMVIRKNSSNDNGCCFVEEDGGTLKPKAYDTKKDLCCGRKILHNANLYGYVCCSKTQKPLVRCSIYDECREYNGSDTCNNYSWSFEDVADPRTYKPTEYNICRLCKGQWSLEDSVDALRKGHIDTCKKSAIVLSVRKKIKKGRVTLMHFIVESNMFNPKDKSTIKNRLRGFFPCRCNNLRRRDKLILMTNVRIGKVMRLGDSDTVLPFSQTIMYEAIWKKLQCPS